MRAAMVRIWGKGGRDKNARTPDLPTPIPRSCESVPPRWRRGGQGHPVHLRDAPGTALAPPLAGEAAVLLALRLSGKGEMLEVRAPDVRAVAVYIHRIRRRRRAVHPRPRKRRQEGADGVARHDGVDPGLEQQPVRDRKSV